MKTRIENNEQFKQLVSIRANSLKSTDPAVATELQQMADTVDIQPPVYTSDKSFYRIVVSSLAVIILVVIFGVVAMMLIHPDVDLNAKIPAMLVSISSAALGAITGLLAPSPRQSSKA